MRTGQQNRKAGTAVAATLAALMVVASPATLATAKDGRAEPSAPAGSSIEGPVPPSPSARSAQPLVAPHSDAATRQVKNLPPSRATIARRRAAQDLRAKLRVSDTTIEVGTKVSFSTKGSRAERGLKRLTIRFGDGTQTSASRLGVTRKHAYAKPGAYTARLTVRDITGKVARTKQGIFVAKKQAGRGFGAEWPKAEDAVTIAAPTAPGATGAGSAPSSVDLRGSAVAVGNQGSLNSCVSWATGYAMMGWYYEKQTGREMTFAPMYVYSQTHGPLDANGQPAGSYAADALKVLKGQGVDTAAHYGSGWASDWRTQPNASQRTNAANFRITGWNTIFRNVQNSAAKVGPNATEIEALKARLAAGNPVAIAFRVRTSFLSYSGGWYDGSGALSNGLHEMLALGYDRRGLYVQNSWGTEKGVQGYVYMTWDAVERDVYEATFADGAVFSANASTDSIKPTITSFKKQFAVGYQGSNAQAPMTFSWSGTDNKGVKQYLLYYRVAGGEWTQLSVDPLQTKVTYNLSFGANYEFAVAAYDTAGNLSNWSLSGSFTPKNYDESVASYSGSWNYFTNSQYMNGRAAVTSQPGATMSVWVTARNFGLVGTRWAGAGAAQVYLDDVYQFTIDNYSSSTRYRDVVAWFNLSGSTQHKITLVAQGTAGRPPIDVDSILVS